MERKLAGFLGAFSFGLGAAQLAFPDRVNRLIGVRDTARNRLIQRAVGAQELSAAGGIVSMSPPTPFLLARVGGDALHLGILSRALGKRRNDDDRLRATIGAVAGITLIDVAAAILYARAAPTDPYADQGEAGTKVQQVDPEPLGDVATTPGNPSITIRASRQDLERRIKDFAIEEHGEVRYATAPGDRGTEIHVDVTKSRNPLKKVAGEDPEQKVRDELRRLKQIVEVGEVTVSEAAPEGPSAKRQLKQRPAQHLDEKELAKIGGER
jgi:hypothetical protein